MIAPLIIDPLTNHTPSNLLSHLSLSSLYKIRYKYALKQNTQHNGYSVHLFTSISQYLNISISLTQLNVSFPHHIADHYKTFHQINKMCEHCMTIVRKLRDIYKNWFGHRSCCSSAYSSRVQYYIVFRLI